MGPAKACYNCMKRRIICDRTEPHCKKCAKKGIDCPGFGVRYRFNAGVAARGKLKGKSYEVPALVHAGAAAPIVRNKGRGTKLKWVTDVLEEPRTKQAAKEQALSASVDTNQNGDYQGNGADVTETCFVAKGDNDVIELPHLQPCIEQVDARTRHLLMHFADYVSPTMMLIDDSTNGYRRIVLPMAISDPMVRRAVCVASAFHLAIQQPELKFPAEAGRGVIISKLKSMVTTGEMFSESTWTTIILLIVGELVNGSDSILTLYRMLISFVQARGELPGTSSIQEFLSQQTHLIEFFTLPVISESNGIQKLLEVKTPAAESPEWPSAVAMTQDIYNAAYRQASYIYVLRAQSKETPLHDTATISLVGHLKDLLEKVDPNSTGAHTLVWPYFVAAAESILPDHRDFFYQRLDHIWITTQYRNVKVALDALPSIWSQRGSRRWTRMLQDIATVIM